VELGDDRLLGSAPRLSLPPRIIVSARSRFHCERTPNEPGEFADFTWRDWDGAPSAPASRA
jgi:hypothetical protein